jgi:hypothetical protein
VYILFAVQLATLIDRLFQVRICLKKRISTEPDSCLRIRWFVIVLLWTVRFRDVGRNEPPVPYRSYISQLTVPGDTVILPCAETAPLAIAAEIEYDDDTPLTVECMHIENGRKSV